MAAGASPSPFTPVPALASSLGSSRTSPPPSNPCLHSTDAGCVGRVGSQGIDGGESEKRIDGGDDPHMRTNAGGGKRPETLQCKNSELPRSQRKKPNESSLVPSARSPTSQPGTAGDGGGRPQCENKDGSRRKKINESCLPTTIIKEKYQKVVEANDKIEKQVLPLKKSQTQVEEGKLPANRSEPRKPRSKKSRNKKSASPGVSSPTQVTSSPGVNYLVRAAAVKREALRRGSPSTPQPPSQNQLGSPSLQDLSPDTRATMSQGVGGLLHSNKHTFLASSQGAEATPPVDGLLHREQLRSILLHGGVGRLAPGSEGSEMQLGDQDDDIDGGEPRMGTDGGGGKWQWYKNLVADWKRRKSLNDPQMITKLRRFLPSPLLAPEDVSPALYRRGFDMSIGLA